MKLLKHLSCILLGYSSFSFSQINLTDGVPHNTGPSSSADLEFALDLSQDSSSLNIFIQGATGDADLVLVEVNGKVTDCEVQYVGSNEACVIKKPTAGIYSFKITVHEAFDDLTVYASTEVYASTHDCQGLTNQTKLNIQSPLLTESQKNTMCDALKRTEDLFFQQMRSDKTTVPGDNNDSVQVNIFANQPAYMTTGQYEQNMQDSASTGIYFESSPETSVARANVNTFEAHRWADSEFYIWELTHEYVHYLDGRYNKQGSFSTTQNHNMTWWTEGLAEYIADNESPYMNVELVHSPTNFELTDIVTADYDSDASPYDWGSLAVRFMVEQKPDDLATLREKAQLGQYTELDTWLAQWAIDNQADFEAWQQGSLIESFKETATELNLGDKVTATSQHGLLYRYDAQAGETLTFTTDIKGGDVDLYLAKDNLPNKYDASSFICRSIENSEKVTCSLQSTDAGRYFALMDAPGYAIFVNAEVNVSDVFVEGGATYQFCAGEVPYTGRDSSQSSEVNLKNDSEMSVQVYWLNNANGGRSASSYATLAPGESWEANWYKGDTFVLADENNNCLATQQLAQGNNALSFDGTSVNTLETQIDTPAPAPESPSSSSGGSIPLSTMSIVLLTSLYRRQSRQ